MLHFIPTFLLMPVKLTNSSWQWLRKWTDGNASSSKIVPEYHRFYSVWHRCHFNYIIIDQSQLAESSELWTAKERNTYFLNFYNENDEIHVDWRHRHTLQLMNERDKLKMGQDFPHPSIRPDQWPYQISTTIEMRTKSLLDYEADPYPQKPYYLAVVLRWCRGYPRDNWICYYLTATIIVIG